MREIKFRALIEYNRGSYLIRRWSYYKVRETPYWENDCKYKVITDDLQYTGLKDKNGKEIYEGDIIGCIKNKFGVGKHEYWSVEYDESEAKFVAYNQINSNRGFCHVIGGCPSVIMHGDESFDCEVIGNIYENPELLEVSHG